MKRVLVFAAVLTLAAIGVIAQPVQGLIAERETEALGPEDRRAAHEAERETLGREQPIQNFEWQGPNGASGVIIVGIEFPAGMVPGRCRDFVHTVRHPRDGGVNPTFRGTVCRGPDGKWVPRGR
jgi:surface antigen